MDIEKLNRLQAAVRERGGGGVSLYWDVPGGYVTVHLMLRRATAGGRSCGTCGHVELAPEDSKYLTGYDMDGLLDKAINWVASASAPASAEHCGSVAPEATP